MTELWEVGKLLSTTSDFFRKCGIDSPDLDAELLLADALNLTRESLLARRERHLTDLELTSYREKVRQRAGSKPVAYILNRKEFYSLPFYVDEQVLIPRPETELLVELSLQRLQSTISALGGSASGGRNPQSPIQICDIGTGSGCIAAALAASREDLRVTATEISEGAARVAVKNISDLGLLSRVRVIHCDLFPPGKDIRFDLIVSNPPYISAKEYESLPRTIRRFEPQSALTDGGDGLGVYRKILSAAPAYLKEGGQLFFEISPGIAAAMPELLQGGIFKISSLHKDLAGLDRVAELEFH